MKKVLKSLTKNLENIQELRKQYASTRSKPKKLKKKKPVEKKLPESELYISNSTIARVLAWIIVFWLLVQGFFIVQNVVIFAMIALFISLGMSPIIDGFERFKFPRPFAIILIYLVFISMIAVVFVGIIPIMAEQLGDIALNIRQFLQNYETTQYPWIERVNEYFQFDLTEIEQFITGNIGQISENLQSVAGSTLSVVKDIFNGILNFIFALVLIFFILMEKESIGHFIIHLLPSRAHEYMEQKSHNIQEKISQWIRGQAILMFSVGLVTYFGLKIFEYWFGMPYALTIAIITGVMGLFPYIGVLLSGALALLVSLNLGVWYAPVAIICLIFITQFLEGNVLSPMIMGKVVGLSPVVVILSLAIMGTLGNHFGGVPLSIVCMIISIPVAASLSIFIEEYVQRDDPH